MLGCMHVTFHIEMTPKPAIYISKSRLFAATIIALGLGASFAGATPINITVAAGDPGTYLHDPTGIADKGQYQAASGAGNNNPDTNLAFLTTMIANWNGSSRSQKVPTLAGGLELAQDSLGDASGYTGPAGYEFVVFHLGNGQAGGSPGGWWQAYYLGGDAISLAVPAIQFPAIPAVAPIPPVIQLQYSGSVDGKKCKANKPCEVVLVQGIAGSPAVPAHSEPVGGFSSARYFGKTNLGTLSASTAVPDGGSTLGLLGCALIGVVALSRRFGA